MMFQTDTHESSETDTQRVTIQRLWLQEELNWTSKYFAIFAAFKRHGYKFNNFYLTGYKFK